MPIKKCWYQPLLALILILLLSACSGSTEAPSEFAPPGEIVQKAIALQLEQTQQQLSQQLQVVSPILEIRQIKVKNLESLVIAQLPTYHLQGTYNLKLKLPRQQVKQKNNPFDLYLQRQAEGKTWRLLKRQVNAQGSSSPWTSYLIM